VIGNSVALCPSDQMIALSQEAADDFVAGVVGVGDEVEGLGNGQGGVDGGFFSSNQLVFVGQTISWSRDIYENGTFIGEGTSTLDVLDHTSVTVPAGTYGDCLHLRLTGSGQNPQLWDWWMARGVGLVKRAALVTHRRNGDSGHVGREPDRRSTSPRRVLPAKARGLETNRSAPMKWPSHVAALIVLPTLIAFSANQALGATPPHQHRPNLKILQC
jgi:hypothetical protein